MRLTRCAVLAVIAVVVVAGVPAAGHERVALDPDDSNGPLDIVAARMRHRADQTKLRVVTYEEWADSTLSGDLDYVRFDLDDPAKAGTERCIVVHLYPPQAEGPTAVDASIYKGCDAPLPYRKKIGDADTVGRPDLHSLEISVQQRTLWKSPPEAVRFAALTSYEDENHPDCQPPDPTPPEHFTGTCTDATAWRRH